MSYLILVNKQSKLVTIEVPDKPHPNEPFLTIEEHDNEIKIFDEALQSAIADKSKHIPFKDEEQIKKILLKDFYKGKSVAFNYTFQVGQTFSIPEGYTIDIKSDFTKEKSCRKCDCNFPMQHSRCDCPCHDINEKLAILEKTSDRVENSADDIAIKPVYTSETKLRVAPTAVAETVKGVNDEELNKIESILQENKRLEAENKRLEEELTKSRALNDAYNKEGYRHLREVADIEAHYASQGMGLYPKDVYDKIARLEEQLKAADRVIQWYIKTTGQTVLRRNEALEKYNALKTK